LKVSKCLSNDTLKLGWYEFLGLQKKEFKIAEPTKEGKYLNAKGFRLKKCLKSVKKTEKYA